MKVVSMRGETLDMGRLMAQNENTVALGNASMNARGDIVGPGGRVIKSREQIATEYYTAAPKSVKQVSLRDLNTEAFVTPAEAVSTITKEVKAQEAAIRAEAEEQSNNVRKRKTVDKTD